MSPSKKFVPTESPPPSGMRSTVTDLAAWAATGRKTVTTKKRNGITKSSYDRAVSQVDVMMKGGNFGEAKPLHIFAMYCKLHEHVYGVPASEMMTPADRQRACFQIANMLRNTFDKNINAMIDFVRWAWRREEGRETWRREQKRTTGSYLCARFLFANGTFTEFRIEMARTQASR